MNFGLILDPVFLKHQSPPGHPERPERLQALLDGLERLSEKVVSFDPASIDDESLTWAHSREYLARLRSSQGKPMQMLDPDTYCGPMSFEVARLAAGGAIRLLELMRDNRIEAGFCLGRPPGHHATPSRAMGFCLLNTAALAAAWAVRKGMACRVAIVDFDVHHGNGTQEIFWRRPDVLYISSHQYPFYPGTGAFGEVGAEKGEGYTANFPVPAGHDDAFFKRLYSDMVVPILRQFKPDLLVVSAGYDPDSRDPLAGMKMSPAGFGAISALLTVAARELCKGRLLYVLEGGYNLDALKEGVLATIKSTIEPRGAEGDEAQANPVFEAYRHEAVRVLGRYWKFD